MQLPLGIKLPDSATFTNLVQGRNSEAVYHLQACLSSALTGHDHRTIYLWGGAGCGKSHLLQAACHALSAQGTATAYVPLRHHQQLHPDMLEGLENLALVCIDDVEAVAGKRSWEDALFHLYNRMQTGAGLLLLSGHAAPSDLELVLADLRSRIGWDLVFQLHPLDDAGKKQALQLRARSRGFTLPDEVADYLLRYYPRDIHAQFGLLDRLDTASLVEQRRLTVPFVKAVLSEVLGVKSNE